MIPRMGGCDNQWRRDEVLANQAGCGGQFSQYFNCVFTRSTCQSGPAYTPGTQCDAQREAWRNCCSGNC